MTMRGFGNGASFITYSGGQADMLKIQCTDVRSVSGGIRGHESSNLPVRLWWSSHWPRRWNSKRGMAM